MMMQLSIKEIEEIISFLQEPYPYELMKRLEQLKSETELNIKLENQKLFNKMEEERQINENGFGTAPVSSAYFQLGTAKTIWLVFCENKVYREILGAYSTYEKAEKAALDAQQKFKPSGACLLNFYTAQVEMDYQEEK